MRKTRSDSVINRLPQNQQDCLERWLCEENLSYKDAAERFFQDFGQRLSRGALERFFQDKAQERTLLKIARSSRDANWVVDELRKNKEKSFEALLGLIGQAAFEKQMKGEELDVSTLIDLAQIAAIGLKAKSDTRKAEQKDNEIAIAARKLELDLQKYKDSVAKIEREINAAKSSGGITPETLTRIEHELKLL